MNDTTNGTESRGREHNHTAPVTIKVNNHAVILPDKKTTGRAVKEAAIEQGVPIQVGFALFRLTGNQQHPVRDDDALTVHQDQQFRCVDADDNS